MLAACGYRADVPTLPGGAPSLTLAPVRNETAQVGLDILLGQRLREGLMRRPAVRPPSGPEDGVELDIRLTRFTITRQELAQQGGLVRRVYDLRGQITVRDRRLLNTLIDGETVAARIERHDRATAPETAALVDQGIADVVDAFAQRVEQRLFRSF